MLDIVDPSTLNPFPHVSFGEHRCFAIEFGSPFALMATTGLGGTLEFVLSIDGRNPLNNEPSSPVGAGVVASGKYVCRGFQINASEVRPFIFAPRGHGLTTGERNGSEALLGIAAVAIYGNGRHDVPMGHRATRGGDARVTRGGGGAMAGEVPVSAPLGQIQWTRTSGPPMYSWTAEFDTRANWAARGVVIPAIHVASPWAVNPSGFANSSGL